MKRDLICCLRLTADLLPRKIRNSRFLFKLAQLLFKVPSELFDFRDKYLNGEINNLSSYYIPSDTSPKTVSLSEKTDINSFHYRKMIEFIKSKRPDSVIDVGCGSGFS